LKILVFVRFDLVNMSDHDHLAEEAMGNASVNRNGRYSIKIQLLKVSFSKSSKIFSFCMLESLIVDFDVFNFI